MSARSKKPNSIYGDFFGDVRREPKIFCDMCQSWIPPAYFKKGKPVYLHTCYDARGILETEAKIGYKKKEDKV